jgi:hypothetical protein
LANAGQFEANSSSTLCLDTYADLAGNLGLSFYNISKTVQKSIKTAKTAPVAPQSGSAG